MKIPDGYGWIRIGLYLDDCFQYADFYNISDNPVIPREISTSYIDINDNVQKVIRGYHIDFNFQLYDKSLNAGTQNGLMRFLKYYNSSDYHFSDRRIIIYPNYDSTGSNWASVFPYAGYWAVLKQAPAIIDIDTYKFAGQVLVLKAQTRIMMTEEEYKIKIYRESTTGAWGLYNAPLLGFSEPAATTA